MEQKKYKIENLSWKMNRILNKFYRLETTPIPLEQGVIISHKELHVLQAIGDNKNLNITGLAEYFGVTKSAASQMTSKLVKKGLVNKELSPQSAKEYLLSLTPNGWQAYGLHEDYHSKNTREIERRLKSFNVGQIEDASRIMDEIESVIEERLANG
jgi:DNA-binding MarR family transcriptional regulator